MKRRFYVQEFWITPQAPDSNYVIVTMKITQRVKLRKRKFGDIKLKQPIKRPARVTVSW